MTATAISPPREDDSDGGPPLREGVPHRRLILGAIAVVVLGAVLTWLVAFSSVFGVRTVRVRGLHTPTAGTLTAGTLTAGTLTAGTVRAAARVPGGAPLIRLDTGAIRGRVEALPDVASAKVTTSFPSTVVITVTERVAIGVVRSVVQGKRGYTLVDRGGDQYRQVRARPAHLPLFVVPKGTDARTTGGAVATVAGALPNGLRARIASIQALDPNAIAVLLDDGRVVRWGSAAQSALKARILPALLRQQGDQFDLTNPAQPFAR